MKAGDEETIEKLLPYLPRFEAGEEITYDNWFMDFYHLVMDEFIDRDYPANIKSLGWESLTDKDFINQASIDQLKTVLTAICRSERQAVPETYWWPYVEAGSFTAILRRLAAIKGGG